MGIYWVNSPFFCCKANHEEGAKLECSNSAPWSVRVTADRYYFVRNVVLDSFQQRNWTGGGTVKIFLLTPTMSTTQRHIPVSYATPEKLKTHHLCRNLEQKFHMESLNRMSRKTPGSTPRYSTFARKMFKEKRTSSVICNFSRLVRNY